jgi:hypothetical protein
MTKEYEEENYTITNITDNKGNSIEYKAENDIEILHWERYKYDLNNKLISTVYLDEAGNECSKDDEHKMKDIYSEKYIYNEKNDWIKEEIYKNNILIESTEREIIYY